MPRTSIFDTLFAMLRRALKHKPIMQADRGHLHHRLIDKGYSQKQAVVILYGISILCGLTAIFIASRDIRTVFVLIFTVCLLSFIIYMFNVRNEKKEKL